MSTLEEIRKAYEDLSDDDKETFKQSISDRVHESIAAQEEDEGEKDTQSAEDREHEALGTEHADEEKKEEKAPESEEEKPSEEPKNDGGISEILERLGKIEASIDEMKNAKGKDVREAGKEEAKDLDKIASIYNN